MKSLNRVRLLATPWTAALPGSSTHGIFQARVLEWGAIAFSKCSLGVILNSPSGTLPWPYTEHIKTRIPFLFIEVASPIYSLFVNVTFFFPFFSEVFLTACSLGYFAGLSLVERYRLSCSEACGIFPDQGLNPCLLNWLADSYPLHYQESPEIYFFYFSFSFICLANVNIPSSSFFKLILDLSIAFCSHSHLLGLRLEHINPTAPQPSVWS